MVTPILESVDNDDSRVQHALKILVEIPTDESVEMILQHWDSLYNLDMEAFLRTIRMLGDQRLIKPLKNELKEDEYAEGEVFCFICRLNGVRDPLLKKIEQNTKKWKKKAKKKMEMLEEKDYRNFFREPVIALLTCRRCGRRYHYELYDIALIPDTKDIIINDVVVCKHCGAVDHYEYGPELPTSLSTLLLLIPRIKDLKPEETHDFTVTFGDVRPIDGKKMTAEEAVEYYEEKLSQNPTNPECIIGLANSLRHVKRSEDAEPLYKLALQQDKKAVDAYTNLGQMAQARKNLKEAYNYYYEAYRILDTGNYYRMFQDKDFFKAHFFNNFVDVAMALGEPVPGEIVEWLKEMDARLSIDN
jgi:tetratricopeptide (TPR) repeat protein